MSSPGQVRALALSCHPLPALAVTAISAGLAALADLSFVRGALVTVAVFTGQLSIGWSNDYLDADRDRAVRRSDKPIAAGAVPRGVARTAVVIAVVLTLAFSAALGLRGGGVAVATVLCGWLYNLGLKGTVLSWLPYALAFGGLPAIATLSASPARWPATWAIAAGALLGVAAHLANVLPDLQDDAATGVRGLPHRLGARASAIVVALVLLGASAVILLGPGGSPGHWRWSGFIMASTLTGAATGTAYRTPASRRFFLTIIVIAAIDVASFALSGTRL
ncbi:MAG: UbiA family prenyltransferase [Jatrophihabitans sp.]